MYSLLLLGAVSFFLALVLTPLVRNFFSKLGMVDYPDEARRLHQHPIPRVGGIAIVLSYLLSFAVLLVSSLNAGVLVSEALPFAWRLFPAAGLVFLTGFLDDILGLKPWQKLAGQLAAGLLADRKSVV